MADCVVADAPAKFKSRVWQYFGFENITDNNGIRTLDKSKTVCKQCRAQISYGTGNTTNMFTHLQRKHPHLYEEINANKTKPSQVSSSVKGVAPSVGQQTIKSAFQAKLNPNSPRALECTKSIGMFMAKDLRPFSVVDNPGFRYMVNTLEPRYKIPSRTYFAEKVVPQLYEEVKMGVISQLSSALAIALTTDGWTSRATQSYETITAHFINDKWDMTNYVLQTRVLGEVHTSHNLAEGLKKAMTVWNLSRNGINPTLTTDNASNVCNAVKEAGASAHIRCFAHTLNLSTRKGLDLPQMDRLLGRVNRIVSFFHRSDTANTQLKAKQKLLDLPQHKLLQDCKTRWNSSFDMLERYVEQQAAVQAVFLSKDIKKNVKDIVTLSDDDVSDIENVLKVLEPIKMVTTILCEEEHPTVSMIHPLQERLLTFLEVREEDTTLVKSVKLAISSDLRERYNFLHGSHLP